MKKTLTAVDIINSVEFELLQGTLRADELGAAVHRLRSYQNRARTALYDPAGKPPAPGDVADLQLQLNEMLLTVIETLDQRLVAMRQETLRVAQLPEPLAIPAPLPAPAAVGEVEGLARTAALLAVDRPLAGAGAQTGVASTALSVEADVRPVRVPLFGGILTRLRSALHALVLYYTQNVARQQTKINQDYDQQLAQLAWQVQALQEEVRQLRAERVDPGLVVPAAGAENSY